MYNEAIMTIILITNKKRILIIKLAIL